ncbi:hypothetical protein MJI69_31755, partial [Salmonella enterica subsp. enterica serovar Anatum]|nr:hypothetical protein [Salmonella enterica subsp. enterica serovar Anatum]
LQKLEKTEAGIRATLVSQHSIEVDAVIAATGLRPETALARRAEVMRHETNMLFVRVGEAQAAALGDYLRERNILINAAPIVRL